MRDGDNVIPQQQRSLLAQCIHTESRLITFEGAHTLEISLLSLLLIRNNSNGNNNNIICRLKTLL